MREERERREREERGKRSKKWRKWSIKGLAELPLLGERRRERRRGTL